eukprot:Lithocolla_globosa_v1_NODE_75_length_6869_cov_16.602289.p1 type:complete len:791 gc:universal NODE_75_length_6869_cov_16.602289:5005-2633(-)
MKNEENGALIDGSVNRFAYSATTPAENKNASINDEGDFNSQKHTILSIAAAVTLCGDLVVTLTLFLLPGIYCSSYSAYLLGSIQDFNVEQSSFDIACLVVGRALLFSIVVSRTQILQKTSFFWSCVLILTGTTIYPIVKFVFIAVGGFSANFLSWLLSILVISLIFGVVEVVLLVFLRQKHGSNYVVLQETKIDPNKDVNEEGMYKNANIIRLIKLVKDDWAILILGMAALIISAVGQLALPAIIGTIVDVLVESECPYDELREAVFKLLVITFVVSVSSIVRGWVFTLVGQRVVARLRKSLFTNVTTQEIAFFDITRTGDLTSRLTTDCQVIQSSVAANISMLLRYSFQMLATLAIIIAISWQLTLVMFSVVPIIVVGAVFYGNYIQALQKSFQDELASATTVAEEVISNVRTMRAFSKEDASSNQYGTAIMKSYDVGAQISIALGAFSGAMGFVPQTAIALVIWYGGVLVDSQVITIGALTSFLLYTMSIAASLAFLSGLFGDFMRAVGAADRIFRLLDRVPDIPISGGKTISKFQGKVVFNEVHFFYPSRPEIEVLNGVSFSLMPGKSLALVGHSGSGKSTVVALMERFYDTSSGTITIDGFSIQSLDPEFLRNNVALVGQEPVLFAKTIAQNIVFGVSREVSQEEIEASAKAANAHSFIMELENGYNTPVGNGGIQLSGGQKQRVAIARALLVNPRILLLDEATSALDAESEFLVQEAIDRAMKNRTVFIIAHRLSTVKNADQIAVLQDGKVVETGNHDTLLAKNGVYTQLVSKQLQSNMLDSLKE